MPDLSVLRVLARAFVAGESNIDLIVSRAEAALGRPCEWLRPVAARYMGRMEDEARPRVRDVVRFLLDDSLFRRAWGKHKQPLGDVRWIPEPARMQPMPAAAAWDVPAIESVGSLAEWLRVDAGRLEWFADLHGLLYRESTEALRHYRYRVLLKRSGSLRLIEAPKPELKALQRRILSEILEKIPAHPAVHGFVKGRSIRTFAAPHVGRRVVVRMDLRDFFPTFGGARIQSFFRTLGYPEAVADRLAGVCTNAAPRNVWSRNLIDPNLALDVKPDDLRAARDLYSRPHLPQGAPTSPALANACAYRIDCRLQGLAETAGVDYTRYADDLAFSGEQKFEQCLEWFLPRVAAIIEEEGFAVHHRKTRVMRRGVRQYLAGLVTNERINVVRADFDVLKATLTNCARLGALSQNRLGHPNFRAHLEGRVGFVEMINAAKGARLRRILERVQWE